MKLRRAIGWVLLAVGTLITAWGAFAVFELVELMDRFGLFGTWDSIWAFRRLFGEARIVLVVGLSLAFAGGWLSTRKPRAIGARLPSHFE